MTSADHSQRLKQRIDEIRTINGGKLIKSEALDLFRFVRRVLEQDGSSEIYPTLSLYCNWLMHVGIDRHPEAFRMLEQIGAAVSHYASGDVGLLCQSINHLIGLKALRLDLLRLFKRKHVSTDILESRLTWHMITGWIIEDVIDIELAYPDDVETRSKNSAAAKAYALAKVHQLAGDWFVRSLRIVDERATGNAQPGLHWELRITPARMEKSAKLKGLLQTTDFSERFERP